MSLVEHHGVPGYDDLPVLQALGLPHAWESLESGTGSLGFIGAEARRRALASALLGETIGLNLPLELIDPPLFGRARLDHQLVEVGRNTYEDVLHDFNPQASSQWDGLLHVRAREIGFFGGQEAPGAGSTNPGIQQWRDGIVGRGVLLDLPRWAAATGRSWDPFGGDEITVEDLADCVAYQETSIDEGDVLCIRSGWVTAYRALTAAERTDDRLNQRFSGLRADENTARFVWDRRLGAICADNPALECAPGDPAVGSLHRRLIPMLGTCVGELLDLDRLAARCDELGRWTFLFVAVPLPLRGGVSSPSNAVAVL